MNKNINSWKGFDHTHIDGLVQERRNSIANALELRLSCTNPSIFEFCDKVSHNALPDIAKQIITTSFLTTMYFTYLQLEVMLGLK